MPPDSAIRVADELARSVVEVAEDVAAARRDVIDDLAPVLITGDKGGGIRRRLGLQLMNEVGHRVRDWRWARGRPEAATGRQYRRCDHQQPRLHMYETLDRTGGCAHAAEMGPD